MTSLRPIVLLSVLRKTLSLVVFARIADKVDAFLSQSGFRHGRSTADDAHGSSLTRRQTQRFQSSVRVLGIDTSRAFDTIRRDELITVLDFFLDESELRIIRIHLAETTLEPRLTWNKCPSFTSTNGTPQGTIYRLYTS